MVVMEQACEALGKLPRRVLVDIHERRDAVAGNPSLLACQRKASPSEVADRLRPALIPALVDEAVNAGDEFLVDRDRDSLHGPLPCEQIYRERGGLARTGPSIAGVPGV